MAQDKKSFLMYCDWHYTVEKLDDAQAGKLLKHLLRYVNDKNPEPENEIIDLVFEPIKRQLKRDLKGWENKSKERSISGRMGNLKRWNIDLWEKVKSDLINLEDAENIANSRKTSLSDKNIANVAVNGNVNVNVTHKYSESVFLENWKSCRQHFLKKPTNIPKLTFQEKNAFQEVVKDYSKEDINNAMKTLFSQERVPVEGMWLRPKHFLEHFETYFSGNGETKIYSSKK